MSSRLSMLAMAGAASLTAFGAAAQTQSNFPPDQAQPIPSQPNLTQTCAFRDGPRAGQTINYEGAVPGAVSVPVGNRCADMQGSSGVAIPQGATGRRFGQSRFYMSPGAPSAWSSPGAVRPGFSQTCRFTSGPRAGITLDYSHTLGAEPVVIGGPCSDGPNSGVAVASLS
jgi:hypothetical protein